MADRNRERDQPAADPDGDPAQPPQSPPRLVDDDDDASFNRSTRSQIRLKVRAPNREDDDDDDAPAGDTPNDDGDDDADDNSWPNNFDFHHGGDDDIEHGLAHDGDEEDEEGQVIAGQDEELLTRRRIDLDKRDWDDSEEEEDDEDDEDDDEEGGDPGASNRRRLRRRRRAQAARARTRTRTSYAHTLTPSRQRRRSIWLYLTSPGAPNSLSIPHVAANLFSASLHPSVLLSAPFYFDRTGVLLGTVGLVVVAVLGGVGGGLWAVLSRYVGNKKTVEAITGASFGRNTKWKGRIGKGVAGILLACYATGSAFIAYFALADLLLQVFFHYSPRGIPLHDRGFVTLVIGGLFTAPLIIVPLAKRTLIRLATWSALLLYPAIMAILFAKIYTIDVVRPAGGGHHPRPPRTPNANPLLPPSIWAPYSLLPLLTLSSSPLQILAHNRSLRRKASRKGAQHGSNVKAFLGAQATQVAAVIGVVLAFGIGMGTRGIRERLGNDSHPNLFATLPQDDHLLNLARVLFVLLLSTHLVLCLAVARSSWARLLKLLNLNPFKWRRQQQRQIQLPNDGEDVSASTPTSSSWGKLARTSLGGFLLWLFVALGAFISGVGGIRRSEKAGEEARYVRASEILGLFGGGVGFVLPAFVWIILFHIRQPRTILPDWVSERARGMSQWVKGELGNLSRGNRRGAIALGDDDDDEVGGGGGPNNGTATATSAPASNPVPTGTNETADPLVPHARPHQRGNDEATRILLARKERQLQKRTRERRLWQDALVLAAVLPCGIVLLCLGAVELSKGGY